MKTILSKAINGIDWNTPESISYILHNKGNHEVFFVENIQLYLNEISKLKFFSGKLIDGVRKRKVDLIEHNNNINGNHFIVDAESKMKIQVARLIDFGHCVTSQPSDYNINKTLTDIRKRTVTQKLTNDYYTVQIVMDINKAKLLTKEKITIDDNEKTIEGKFEIIDGDYQKLDADYVKIPFHLSDGANNITIYFYICGPFNSESWQSINETFKNYKTLKGKSLAVFNS